ncbi:MAG: hypothetical protein M0P12_03325 [Paludibacteraceae bacterium]|nr:hypothetical protein [Paludibacteraceae bacterium]MCK9616187.1 hypothetical protein [Candidatus Omnitrophota bacterium]
MNFLFSEEYDVWVGKFKKGSDSGWCAIPLHFEVKAPKTAFICGIGNVHIKNVEILRFKEFSYSFLREVYEKYGFSVLATMLNVRFEDMATRNAWYFLRDIILEGTSKNFDRFQKVFDATILFQKILKEKYGFDQIIRPYDNRCYCYGDVQFFYSVLPIHYMGHMIDNFPIKALPILDVIKYERVLNSFICAAVLSKYIGLPEGAEIKQDGSVRLPDMSCKDMIDLIFGEGTGEMIEATFQ